MSGRTLAILLLMAGCASHNAAPVSVPTTQGSGRPVLGIVPDLMSEDSQVGVLIAGTTPGTPAASAGLQAGDLLVRFNNQTVQNLADLTRDLGEAAPGSKVDITVLRATKTMKFGVVLAQR